MLKPTITVPGYKLERMLARGGMAEVYLAEQLSLGRKVAIKILDSHSGDHEFAERFLHEARLVAALNHTNLITIYDFGKLAGGKLFLSMEYLQGGDLEERLPKGIPEKDALRNLRQLANMLSFVHKNGVVHRDIKPANILFRQDGTLVLTDFGIAKKVNNDVALTQAGMMVGSPAYSSPEQMQGLELDQRADIYSVGVVFLEMLIGRNPFKSDSFIHTAMNHIQMEIPRLQGALARYQPLLDKMLAKKPKDRFASMDQLLNKLDIIAPITAIQPSLDLSKHKVQQKFVDNSFPDFVPSSERAAINPTKSSTKKISSFKETGLDDFLDEAIQSFDDDDFSVIKHPGLPLHQPSRDVAPPSNMRGGHSGNFRNRPLPRNLLDDDE